MANTCNAIGAYSKLLLEGGAEPRTFDASSVRLIFGAESLTDMFEFSGMRQAVGDLGQHRNAIRKYRSLAVGTINTFASAEDFHIWLPLALNGTTTSDIYHPGSDLTNAVFDLLAYRENAVFRFSNCRVNKLSFTSRSSNGSDSPEFIFMSVQIVGIKEEVDPITWPSPEPPYPTDLAHTPYMHWEQDFEINSVPVKLEAVNLEIDNKLRPVGYNKITPTNFRSAGRTVTVSGIGDFTADTIDEMRDSTDNPLDCVLDIVNTAVATQTQFEINGARNIGYVSPYTKSKSAIPMQFALQATKTSVEDELIVTNDHTA